MRASLVPLERRMSNELQSSRKLSTKPRGAKRNLIPHILSHMHGCQYLCMVGSPCEMMPL